jgi:DNA-binding GntR family transcriptional regulator
MKVRDPETEQALERNVLALQVYERVLARITDRQLAPGQRLNIYALARSLNVSITPVREALARLSSQQLVEFEPYKGYRVLPLLDASQISQLFDVRILAETHAVRTGVPRATAVHIAALQLHVEAMRQLSAGEPAVIARAFNDKDRLFHHVLIDTAGNEFLSDVYETLSPLIHIGRYYQENTPLAADQIITHHLALVSAYEQRDATSAEEHIRQHLFWARERLLRTIEVPDPAAGDGREIRHFPRGGDDGRHEAK